ncbi:MAG: hypothetical protein R2681_12050 [Pyrinomonadaceae bacterium]
MNSQETTLLTKLRWNLPWLVRYPFERTKNFLGRNAFGKQEIIFTIADHFEPSWSPNGLLGIDDQKRELEKYHKLARKTGEAVKDADGTKFRHTNFYPAEQYDPGILDKLAEMQSEGLGEVEIHLHHGVEKPDTAENLRRELTEFRDKIAEKHQCLSRFDGEGIPRYAFVHGNLALANSCGGRFCGVDEEMQILADTGCYADMTLPSAPDQSQVEIINKIYECGGNMKEAVPHKRGISVSVNGILPQLPLIFTGPLVFNWTRTIKGIPVPRIDDGALVANQPADNSRMRRWRSANITVNGQPEWVFIKLYCHGFFAHDQKAAIGEDAARFFSEIIEYGERTGKYRVHFASAREAANMVFAAIEGKKGDPNKYRDHRLKAIMDQGSATLRDIERK